jgi:PAS domain S-box-containing protein
MFAPFLLTFWLRLRPAAIAIARVRPALLSRNIMLNGFLGPPKLKKFQRNGSFWRISGRYLGTVAVVALAYFALAKLGLQLASVHPSASPIWPPTGLALAVVLLGGLRLWPAVFIGAFAANATTAGTLETSALIALGNTFEAVVGGVLIGRWSGGADTFSSPGRVAKFALVSVGPAPVIAATVGVTTLCAAGFADWANFLPVWVTWWLGDAAGALVVTPVIVLWVRSSWRGSNWLDAGAVLGCAVAVGLVAFSPVLPRSDYTSPLGFLAILPLLWAALRCGPRETATVALILTGFAIWGRIAYAGPFGEIDRNESFLLLLSFMISATVPSLVLSADVAMRRRTDDHLRQTQAELDTRVRERTAALADANIHLSEAQRLAHLGSWSWDVASNRVVWSDGLYEIYGTTPEAFGGTLDAFVSFIHLDDRAKVQTSIGTAIAMGGHFNHEERIVRPDGTVRYLHSTGEVIRDKNGAATRMLGVCLDVTDRKQAELALSDSEHSYRILLEGVRDYAIFMMDTGGHVRSWNAGAATIKGYTDAEIIGQHFSRFYPEEDRVAGVPERALATAARDGKFELQGWRLRKDGSRFYANVVIDAIRDKDGQLVGFAKITRDITAQREAEVALEQTREQLAQAQKMEALGQLTGGIAHDFNNLLMIVSGYAQILQRRMTEPKDVQAVEAIRAATVRGEKLTRQLLAFSRRQQLMPVVVDLRQRMDAVRDMLAPSLRGNIALVCDIEDKIWPVEVDLGELELALVNVAVNARDAMPEGGTITLQARNVVLKPGSAAGALDGDFVAVAIIDSGTGIAPDLLTRVFEPFFTTKPVGKGTGLGLSQVHGFANQSGGAVTVSSELGKGTVVTIYLPRSNAATAAQSAEDAASENGATQGTVLVVEDSRDVGDVTSALLQQLGYRVVRAENAAEALRHLQQGIEFDLVFSDIVMPGAIDGLGLAQICREQFPNIPVLLASGFSEAAQAADGRFDILRKPFELSALERAIEALRAGA